MISIDEYAYGSRLRKEDPFQKMLFSLIVIGVCLWADHPAISVAVLLMMAGITVFMGGIPLRFFLKLLLVPMSFLLIGVLTIAVDISRNPGDVLAAVSVAGTWIGLSRTGIPDAAGLFLKALGAVSCLYFLSLGTPMADLLAALRKLRVPKLLVELMGLIYRFIFVLLETADAIHHAQSCRLGYSSLAAGYRSLGALGSVLFIRSYKRSGELYTALEARGYEGELNVLDDREAGYRNRYLQILAVNLLLVLAAVLLKMARGGLI